MYLPRRLTTSLRDTASAGVRVGARCARPQ
jgi:hypothetical protein